MLPQGLYEQVISNALSAALKSSTDLHVETVPLDKAEAAKALSQYLSALVEQKLAALQDTSDDINDQVVLANQLVELLAHENAPTAPAATDTQDGIATPAEQLLALYHTQNNVLTLNPKAKIARPETSIAQSSLFTGAVHEPQMYSELKKEILSCNRIDMLVSFIKWSGLRLLMDELTAFTQNSGELRVITTSYMGATDVKAIEELRKLPNTTIKVSYDTKRTRLHAKTYVFYRDTGFTTAYVGSSNLSAVAMSSGLEWNVKVTQQDLPDTIEKIAATFESYWNTNEFEYYHEDEKERLARALRAEKYFESTNNIFLFDITPYAYQQEILDNLQAERTVRGQTRNLVVAATGTGKTVIAAFDYKRFAAQNAGKPCRLLFVAHREEILKQSRATFQGILKDPNFGALFVGGYQPDKFDHLFISIQTFNSQDFTSKTSPDFFDYIVVDEFHHAAAPTYQKLLGYYQPSILLGLTATPERMDGKSILPYFNNRIAAEIRLPEAIDRKLLCPFQYFGITDTTDLNTVKWARGGYERAALSNLYTLSGAISEQRADNIIQSTLKYVTDITAVKGLGFCVSIEHARFMASCFANAGIAAIALTGHSSTEERNTAKDRLLAGEIQFIFAVDIYNEGVDIPAINTVLFLRPTESLTIFLQQLGRGLRLAEHKDCLTVLDFIGQANQKYNFESKFAALLTNTDHSVAEEIQNGFLSAPKGCYIQLERKAKQYILDNIKASFGRRAGLIASIATFTEDSGLPLTFANFLNYYHINVSAFYGKNKNTFSRLCVLAGVRPDFSEPLEPLFEKALPRFSTMDSRRFFAFVLSILDGTYDEHFTPMQTRMLQMLLFTIWQKPLADCGFGDFSDMIATLLANKTYCAELRELLQLRFEQINFVDQGVDVGFDCPLDLHCTYSRDQILVALDFLKPATVREGIKYLPDQKIDVLFVTLNKADKDYSPTTMYHDYSINERLFHWQSQSTTSEHSKTGQRYISHQKTGNKILLFVREFKTYRRLGTAGGYTYLGLANYSGHTGSRPMNITWNLEQAIPAKFIKKTNKLVVG